MSGRHINDHQMRLFMKLRTNQTVPQAALKAGVSRASGYRMEADRRLPTQKQAPRGRRRPDPLEGIFDQQVVPLIEASPELRPVAIHGNHQSYHR